MNIKKYKFFFFLMEKNVLKFILYILSQMVERL